MDQLALQQCQRLSRTPGCIVWELVPVASPADAVRPLVNALPIHRADGTLVAYARPVP